ncbi:MAG: GWxTD domain-containing protein [bacterium]
MLMAGVLLLAALPVQGSLELTLDQAVYAAEGATRQLDVSYEIPHASLAFLRVDSGFAARFRVGIDLLDGRGNPVAGDFADRRVEVADYDETVSRTASIVGTLSVAVPAGAGEALVQVSDLGSERRARARFRLGDGGSGLRLVFLKSGEPNPARAYAPEDTLEVRAEVLDQARPDSVRFAVRDGRRPILGRAVAVEDSGGRFRARLVEPLADSSGAPAFPGGEYRLEAAGVGGTAELRAQAGFRFMVPFFLDETAWRNRVDRLVWVATVEQMRELRGLAAEEREPAWREFWQKLDPSPTTGHNEREVQYFERIEYAEEHFGRGDRGYRSDRARVYVTLGAPDQVDARPFELDSYAYEVWNYYSLGLEFVFADRYGFGEYVMESPRSWRER